MRKSRCRYRYFLGIVCLLVLGDCAFCDAQMVESRDVVESIEMDVVNVLISNNELEGGSGKKQYANRIGIYELLDERALGYEKTGIYRVRVYSSHTKQYLLIIGQKTHQIVDTDSLGKALHVVVEFLANSNLPNDKVKAYVEAVLELYAINENRDPAKPRNK